jgi:hypothetical protein
MTQTEVMEKEVRIFMDRAKTAQGYQTPALPPRVKQPSLAVPATPFGVPATKADLAMEAADDRG